MKFGGNPEQLRSLAGWLVEQEAEEVVMESTAQYWKPVWGALERYWKPVRRKREGAGPKSGTLHLAQAQSNRGRRGRKKDFADAERLVKRLVAEPIRLYGSQFELVGDPLVISNDVVLVDAVEEKSGESCRVRIPVNIVRMATEQASELFAA